ncbi:DUF1847 domain-containing protein [Thermodesulfobacteriota bacterium]
MEENLSGCARCPYKKPDRLCRTGEGKSPSFCPTENQSEIVANALEVLKNPDIFNFLKQSSVQEGEGYEDKALGPAFAKPSKPRIVELIEFAQKMAYKRLGLAFCMGLSKEAKIVDQILSDTGFDVISAICKVGRCPKETLGIQQNQKIRIGEFESMCNPIAQAFILNDAQTEFNVMMGLCVGHDSMFLKHAAAPCTVLAVKDRVLGHNPLAAIYTVDTYYRYLKKE